MPVDPDFPAVRGSRPRLRRVLLWTLVVLLALGVELAIRVGEPKHVATSGVDTLTVPWPAPDPDAFVDEVDHPWWPMRRGTSWVLDAGSLADRPEHRVAWSVREQPGEVAGVRTTTLDLAGRLLELAQDRDGNVWVLAVEGPDLGTGFDDWSVAYGAPAGLFLPARPRRGDGHAMAAPGDRVTERVEVGERSSEPVVVPAGTFDDTLDVEFATVPEAAGEYGAVRRVVLARGVGPVRTSANTDGVRRLVEPPGA